MFRLSSCHLQCKCDSNALIFIYIRHKFSTRGHHPHWQTPCLHRHMCGILDNKIIQINYEIQNISQLFSKKLQGTCFCSTLHMSCGCKQFKTAKWHHVCKLQSCLWSQFFVQPTVGYERAYFVLAWTILQNTRSQL